MLESTEKPNWREIVTVLPGWLWLWLGLAGCRQKEAGVHCGIRLPWPWFGHMWRAVSAWSFQQSRAGRSRSSIIQPKPCVPAVSSSTPSTSTTTFICCCFIIHYWLLGNNNTPLITSATSSSFLSFLLLCFSFLSLYHKRSN